MARPGQFRHRLLVQEATETADAAGQLIKTWTTLRKWWASVEPQAGTEQEVGERIQGRVTHNVEGRYVPDVLPRMRLVKQQSDGNRTFEIEGIVNPDSVRRVLRAACVEIV